MKLLPSSIGRLNFHDCSESEAVRDDANAGSVDMDMGDLGSQRVFALEPRPHHSPLGITRCAVSWDNLQKIVRVCTIAFQDPVF